MRKSVLALTVGMALGVSASAQATGDIWDHLGVATQDQVSQVADKAHGNYERSKKNHDRIDMVKAKAVKNHDRIDMVKAKAEKNHDRIDMVKGKVEHTDGRVDKLKGEVKSNESFIAEVDTKVSANGVAIEDNAQSIATVQATTESHAETNVKQDTYIAQNARTVSNYHTAMQQGFQRQQSQLNDHEQRITGLEQDVHGLRNDVDQLKGGVALGIAVGTLQYDLSDTSSTQMAVATGYYSDHSAIAVGMGTPLSESAFFNANVSATNDGQVGAGAGLTFKFR